MSAYGSNSVWTGISCGSIGGSCRIFSGKKSGKAIELLKKQLAPNARVLRDGTWQEIPARELVPGDIVHIRLGDIVPVDAIRAVLPKEVFPPVRYPLLR